VELVNIAWMPEDRFGEAPALAETFPGELSQPATGRNHVDEWVVLFSSFHNTYLDELIVE
jgi:hypothetical protein